MTPHPFKAILHPLTPLFITALLLLPSQGLCGTYRHEESPPLSKDKPAVSNPAPSATTSGKYQTPAGTPYPHTPKDKKKKQPNK